MKLEVGMYVRTENGVIEKVYRIYDRHTTDNIVVWLNGYGDGKSVFIDDFEEIKYQSINARGFIKKEPSFNIIDLIEVGDIIKFDITDIDNYADIQGYNCWEISCEEELNGVKEMIEMESAKLLSIVTKEQFESISYRVGEE